jgi:citrate lyase subunit beta/citryl-CoA lyase
MLNRIEKRKRLAHGNINLIPLIETAKGVVNSLQIVSSSPRVMAVAFGAGDYYRDLGRDVSTVSENAIELLYARSTIVNMSRAAGVQAIDTPYLGSLTDKEAFAREVKLAVQLGFKGKQCIHPSQIEAVNSLFSPTQEDVARAGRIVEAFKKSKGVGVISFEGKMADIMTYHQATETLAAAQSIEDKSRSMNKVSYVGLPEIFSQQTHPTRRRQQKRFR